MLISSTRVSIPYTANNSSTKRSMNLLCKLIKTSNDNVLRDVYEGSINAKISAGGRMVDNPDSFFDMDVVYKGFEQKCYIKENPIKHSLIETSKNDMQETSAYIVRVYFPMEGIYTYYKNAIRYHVSIYTYMKGASLGMQSKRIYLYSGVLNSYDNIACDSILHKGISYQEYQDIHICDITNFIESGVENSEYILNVTVQPVYIEGSSIYAYENISQGSSSLSYYIEDSLQVVPSFDDINREIDVNFYRNTEKVSNIHNYIASHYGPDFHTYIRYFVVDKYDEIIYIDKMFEFTGEDVSISYESLFGGKFEQWADWNEGMQLSVSLEVYNKEINIKDILEGGWSSCFSISMQSEDYPITLNRFKFILPNDVENINLTNIDMTVNSYNVTCEIVNQNININQTSVGNGMIKPVFFKAYDISKIKVHRDVFENVCVNLDEYKNKIDKFYIKICGNYFPEYARTIDGVVFNINGAVITSNTGSYYICDGDKNYITSGKYECE